MEVLSPSLTPQDGDSSRYMQRWQFVVEILVDYAGVVMEIATDIDLGRILKFLPGQISGSTAHVPACS